MKKELKAIKKIAKKSNAKEAKKPKSSIGFHLNKVIIELQIEDKIILDEKAHAFIAMDTAAEVIKQLEKVRKAILKSKKK